MSQCIQSTFAQLTEWVHKTVGIKKIIGPNDIHELTSILQQYNLKITDWFSKIIFSFAVHESMAKALSINKTFLEHGVDLIKDTEDLFN